MKKITKTAAVLSCAALFTLAACSSSSNVSISPNWYSNTTLTTNITDTYESLLYDVTYTEGENDDVNFTLSYDTGTYSVTLENATYESQLVYKLSSELSISGAVAYGSESYSFDDSVTSVCYFLNASKSLYPLYSLKTVKSTTPSGESVSALSEAYTEYTYTMEVTYDTAEGTAVSVYTDLSDGSVTECEYDLKTNATILDNENLLFAVRGFSLSEDSSESVYVLNPYANSQDTVVVECTEETSDAEYTFTDITAGETEATAHTLDVNTVGIIRNTTFSGTTITAYYAAPISDANTYRCVMLAMESPLSSEMGTLTYTLSEAEFTTK